MAPAAGMQEGQRREMVWGERGPGGWEDEICWVEGQADELPRVTSGRGLAGCYPRGRLQRMCWDQAGQPDKTQQPVKLKLESNRENVLAHVPRIAGTCPHGKGVCYLADM